MDAPAGRREPARRDPRHEARAPADGRARVGPRRQRGLRGLADRRAARGRLRGEQARRDGRVGVGLRLELRGSGVDLSVVMPGLVAHRAGVGHALLRGLVLSPEPDVAHAIVAAIERPRFDVYVPRAYGAIATVGAAAASAGQRGGAAPRRRRARDRPDDSGRAGRPLRGAGRARQHAVGSGHRRSRAGPRLLHGTGVERRPPVADGRGRGVRPGGRGPRAACDGRLHARARRRLSRCPRARAPGVPRRRRAAPGGALRVLAEPHADVPRRGRARDRMARPRAAAARARGR